MVEKRSLWASAARGQASRPNPGTKNCVQGDRAIGHENKRRETASSVLKIRRVAPTKIEGGGLRPPVPTSGQILVLGSPVLGCRGGPFRHADPRIVLGRMLCVQPSHDSKVLV